MRATSPAAVRPSWAAISSSTAQNSGSSATEVAWPASSTERFFSVDTYGTATILTSTFMGAPPVMTEWRVSVVKRRRPSGSRISARTA